MKVEDPRNLRSIGDSTSIRDIWDLPSSQIMKFSFSVRVWSKLDRARTGTLNLGTGKPLADTPCLLLTTRKGLPAFITPELLDEIYPAANLLQISPIHFLETPPTSLISGVGGIHLLVGLPEYGLAAFARDSLMCEANGQGTTKLGAAFETSGGRRLVGPSKYMELVNALKPDFWGSLPDEVPAWVSTKRNRMSVDRTLNWLDHCLSLHSVGAIFGTVVGGVDLELRMHSAQETAKRRVSGFSLGGFGLGESKEERAALLEVAIERLPAELPRHVSGLGMPEEVLEAVSAGCDILDSTYPHTLTTGGYAMTFPLSIQDEHDSEKLSIEECATLGSDSSKINLRSMSYRSDTSPLLKSCECHACCKYSRAYIHHLLNTHEMLAQTLLDIHNVTHYLRFFAAIREAISQNSFDQYKSWFVSRRR
ncbi:hypothetical protein O6H91_14G017700 [Diphasiastrum complanatum]|uniref:Uncharacterized protein n=1 Tax=Diphasiastrum complanatum TaxID=34168 RepID=A0ACC2BLW3_DIPCM|nr:hypothetical protein O6H91_14G017700 [Diphasiastrum complanatum]